VRTGVPGMELKKVTVTNFRCIEDSGPFTIDQVTCLVGKNEAGKSAILQALASLNPHPSTPFKLDKERDYPRRFLTQYATRHPTTAAVVVDTIWKITDAEKAAIETEFGTNVLKSDELRILRRYDSNTPEWTVDDVDLVKVFEHFFSKFDLDDAEINQISKATTTTDLIEEINKLLTRSANLEQLLEHLKQYGQIEGKIKEILERNLPYFMYFSNYDRMEGAVQIDQLNQLKNNK
jgi:predicted ATP-dependent endonuclease of OLD family